MSQISEIKFRFLASDIPLENTEQFSDMARTFTIFNYYFGTPNIYPRRGEMYSVVHTLVSYHGYYQLCNHSCIIRQLHSKIELPVSVFELATYKYAIEKLTITASAKFLGSTHSYIM